MAGLDDLLSQVLGGGGRGDSLQQILGPMLEMINSQGGIQGLLAKLQSSGLADQVGSWISTGQNAMVDPSQLTEALGADKVEELAKRAGVPVDQASTALSEALPNLVDKLSPGGSLPSADQASDLIKMIPGAEGFADQLTGLLNGLLGGR